MSFDIYRNVAGIFISEDRKTEIDVFSEAARTCVHNYTGCAYSNDDPDNIRFIFDGGESQQSVMELDAFLSGFLDRSLIMKRREIMDKINILRDKVQYDHFKYDGRRWDARPEARALITGASALAIANGGNLPQGFLYRDYDNYNWPMTGIQMIQLGASLFEFTGHCYQVSWIHKYCVGICTTKQELDAYDYTVGWPPID